MVPPGGHEVLQKTSTLRAVRGGGVKADECVTEEMEDPRPVGGEEGRKEGRRGFDALLDLFCSLFIVKIF